MCEKTKTSTKGISQRSQSIWMEINILVRIVSLTNLIPSVSHAINIQEGEPDLHAFIQKLACSMTFADLIFFKLSLMMKITELCILLPV